MQIRTPSDLAALIRDHRTRLGLDQGELAKQVGVSRKWIVEVEGGKSSAEVGLILRTLRVLRIALEVKEDAAAGRAKNPAPSIGVNVDALVESMKKR